MVEPGYLTATAAHALIRRGDLTCTQLLRKCCDRIQASEPQIQAWQYLDLTAAWSQAAAWDRKLDQTPALPPPLLGIPVALKDIFATTEMPTSWGMPFYRQRVVAPEATVVGRLKAAGAIILGKTVTTEMATAAPGPTRNPHHLKHTPGGSSSGSAAAVAAGMVPLAIGSQTMGSILRPAAYCGVLGFKSSFGLISRYGMMPVCRDLDHVGVFARSLDDIQRLVEVLSGPDGLDPDCRSPFQPAAQLPQTCRLRYFHNPYGPDLEPAAVERLAEVRTVLSLGQAPLPVEVLPAEFKAAWEQVQTLCACGLATNHAAVIEAHSNQCSAALKNWVRKGQQAPPLAYAQARQATMLYSTMLPSLFQDCDGIVTPVTTGAAPPGLADTGSPFFCSLWTLLGCPAINLPVGTTAEGLPLGCQLVGMPGQDAQLLATATRCWRVLRTTFGEIAAPNLPSAR